MTSSGVHCGDWLACDNAKNMPLT